MPVIPGPRRHIALLSVAIAALAAATGCGGGSGTAATTTAPTTAPTTVAPTTTRPTTPVPTTKPYSPTQPQTTPDGAAALAVQYWADGDRAGAAKVASPSAVAALFAIHFPTGELQARGCTDPSTSPGTCTYRNLATDGIYEIGVTHIATGWYVSSVLNES